MENLCHELLAMIHNDNLRYLFGICGSYLAKIYLNDLLTSEFVDEFKKAVNDLKPTKKQEFMQENLHGMLMVIQYLVNRQPKREYEWICKQLAHEDKTMSLARKIAKMKEYRPIFFNEHEFLGATELIIYIKYN